MYKSKGSLLGLGLFLLLMGACIAVVISCAAKKEIVHPPWKGKYSVLVIAHRGFSGQYPENTIVAFQKAIDLGCDMIELDVHFSKDNEIVVIHDDKLDRTTNGKGRVYDFSLKEIRNLDAGSWFGSNFSGEKVPTLKEVLQMAKDKIPVNIEIKSPKERQYPTEELAERALKVVKDAGMLHQVNFFSFDPSALRRIKEKEPKAWITLIYGKEWKILREVTGGEDYPILGLRDKTLAKDDIAKIHQQGSQIYIWTVDNPAEMEKFIAWRVDGIITNHPDRLIKALKPKLCANEGKFIKPFIGQKIISFC